MKKQRRRVTKLGPCASSVGHEFPKGPGEVADFDYRIKVCLHCGGRFWLNAPFKPTIRNSTPSPAQIAERVAAALKEDEQC